MYVKSNPCPYFLHNKRTSKRGNQVNACMSRTALLAFILAFIESSVCKKNQSFSFQEESNLGNGRILFSNVGKMYHLPSNQIQVSHLYSIVHYRTCARQQASNDIFIVLWKRPRHILISDHCFHHPNLCHYPYHRLFPRVAVCQVSVFLWIFDHSHIVSHYLSEQTPRTDKTLYAFHFQPPDFVAIRRTSQWVTPAHSLPQIDPFLCPKHQTIRPLASPALQ